MASGRQLRVFLAHARSDQEDVRNLYHRLARDGMEAWLDEAKLLPGQDWEYEIRQAVRASDVVIVCLSQQFNRQRGYRQKEVRIALEEATLLPEGQIFIIPARLEECDLPESLRRWQRVDLFEIDGYKKLLQALRRRATAGER
jgi:TIR domain-containing protein